jgi:hypothetical protein
MIYDNLLDWGKAQNGFIPLIHQDNLFAFPDFHNG